MTTHLCLSIYPIRHWLTIMVVNKAMPVFEKAFYSLEIPENIPLLMPVVHIQANDSEGPRIVYTITEGDPLNQFSINFNTGVIQVVKPLDFETHPAYKLSVRATDSLTGAKAEVFMLDHEENPSHKLMIRAVDGGVPALSSEVMVLIDVTDLNDNTP
uniref:Cadherin domain-containing protein n=1 Tax=Cyprinus carpio TaxID=7962 RepID=A0A8C2FH63_CYPCA